MSRPRNRYRNQVGVPWLAYSVIVGMVVLGFGCGYVYLKNQHHLKEDAKLAVQHEIAKIREETARLSNRIEKARSPEVLRARMNRFGLNLEEISTSQVIHVDPVPPAGGDAGGLAAR